MREKTYTQTDRQTDRQGKRPRNSSLELLRIVAIIIIIMHHFGVHGVFHFLDSSANIITAATFSWQMMFTQLVCWGGGMGNAIFILITGYFMVSHSVHWKKLALLLMAMLFYSWLIVAIVYGGHFLPYKLSSLVNDIFPIFYGQNWFVSCYIIFSLFIPFINIFLLRLTKFQYQVFLLLFFMMFAVLPSFKFATFFANAPIVFFFLVYACGGYLKLHGKRIIATNCHNRYLKAFLVMLGILLISIVVQDIAGLMLHKDALLKGSARLTQLLQIPMAISLFLYFLARPYFCNAHINCIAGTVLGIYLIHDNDLMRKIIWDYIFPNLDYIQSSWYVLFYVIKVFAVFAICSMIELLRKRYVERPLSAGIDRCWPSLQQAVLAIQVRWKRWSESV